MQVLLSIRQEVPLVGAAGEQEETTLKRPSAGQSRGGRQNGAPRDSQTEPESRHTGEQAVCAGRANGELEAALRPLYPLESRRTNALPDPPGGP